jgi:hypothetical protein
MREERGHVSVYEYYIFKEFSIRNLKVRIVLHFQIMVLVFICSLNFAPAELEQNVETVGGWYDVRSISVLWYISKMIIMPTQIQIRVLISLSAEQMIFIQTSPYGHCKIHSTHSQTSRTGDVFTESNLHCTLAKTLLTLNTQHRQEKKTGSQPSTLLLLILALLPTH